MKTLRRHYLSVIFGAIFFVAMAAAPAFSQDGSGMPPEGMQGAPGGGGMPGGGFPVDGPGGMRAGHSNIDAAKKVAENAVIVINGDNVEIREDAATLSGGRGASSHRIVSAAFPYSPKVQRMSTTKVTMPLTSESAASPSWMQT